RHRLQLVSGSLQEKIGTEPNLVGQVSGPRASEEAFGIAGVSACLGPFRRNGTVVAIGDPDVVTDGKPDHGEDEVTHHLGAIVHQEATTSRLASSSTGWRRKAWASLRRVVGRTL